MIRKLFYTVVIAMTALAVKAQTSVGSWEIYSAFSSVSDIVDTPEKVYYLSAGYLYSYDKVNDESYAYSVNNKLHDTSINKIKYNPAGKFLVIIYNNANIDLLYDNGDVVNMSDIKDAVLTISPVINDVDFTKDKMVCATNFGLVLYDTNRYEVIESGMYDKNMKYVAMTDDYIYVYYDLNGLYFAPIKEHIYSFDKFDKLLATIILGLHAVDNETLLAVKSISGAKLYKHVIDLENKSIDAGEFLFQLNNIGINKNGLTAVANNELFLYNNDNTTQKVSLPAEIRSNLISFWSDPYKVWAGDASGVGEYDIKDGGCTVLHDRYKPNSLNASNMAAMYALEDGGVVTWNYSFQNYYGVSGGMNWKANKIKDGKAEEYLPEGLPNSSFMSMLKSPNATGITYYSMALKGLYGIRPDGSVSSVFVDKGGTPLHNNIDCDGKGNIFIIDLGKTSWISMLPKSKENEFDNSDNWVCVYPQSLIKKSDGHNSRMCVAKKSNIGVFHHNWMAAIGVFDTNGTDTTADDKAVWLPSVVDQDGKTLSMSGQFMCITEDLNGNIWIGGQHGILQMSNCAAGLDNIKYSRVKVPRNDGTNYADYLLEGEEITSIAVDSSNRKWISTKTNGVYLVAADGSEIIEHFTTDNSSLPSNLIYEVVCDKVNNSVYFTTPAGLVKYNSTAAPAASDFSDVYAYPNPVRPEYTGWIIVKNLMDNSLVKIADSAGNVFFQGRSEGGMVAWDGCDQAGNRVRTGVYYVFASNSSNGGNMAVVTKILVVQ